MFCYPMVSSVELLQRQFIDSINEGLTVKGWLYCLSRTHITADGVTAEQQECLTELLCKAADVIK